MNRQQSSVGLRPSRPLWVVALVMISWVVAANLSLARTPNVVLILTDNQSYYELGCHGHPHVKTPRIDAFAREAVDFTNFHAPPFCSPSRALLLTGQYAMRSGIHNTIGGVSILHRDKKTVADALRNAGYRTAVFGKWHLGFSYPYHPTQRGFDEVFVHGGGGIGQLEDYFGNDHLDATFDDGEKAVPTEGFTTDVLFARAADFIQRNQERPFFCFVSTPATHRPWQAHPQAAEAIRERGEDYPRNDMALYSMIENIDDNVGQLLDLLDEKGLAKNTLVILATDQGTRRARLHKGLGYDEYHQVFCMMRYPPLTTGQARQSDVLAGMVDVMPTILDVCDAETSQSQDGRSLVPALQGRDRWPDDRHLIVQCPRGRERAKWKNVSVKSQSWRLVDGESLFQINADPDQLENVAGRFPNIRVRLASTYERFWKSLPPADALLSRHLIGNEAALEVKLNAMDWYKGGSPWHQLHMPKFKGNGAWPVEITRAGRYRFELRHHPREHSAALMATGAKVTIGDVSGEVSLDSTADHAVIELALQPGLYDLMTSFSPAASSQRSEPWGALFAYVKYLGH